jgi:hypothetical protein
VVGRAYGAQALWFLGYPDKSSQALTAAERLSNPHIYVFALSLAAVQYILCNAYPQAFESANASSTICTKYGFPQWTASAMIARGRATAAIDRPNEGIAELERGFAL